MSYPAGYDPSPLAPKIIIHDIDGVLKYTFEAASIFPAGTRDFALEEGAIHLGVNADLGHAAIAIDDRDNQLLDGTLRQACKIKPEWTMQIYLGKTSGNIKRWFYGKIKEPIVRFPGTNEQKILLPAVSWAIIVRDRLTSIKRTQKKTSDGITLDDTDTDAKISEICKDIIQNKDHHLGPGLPVPEGITVTQVEDIDIKLANFSEKANTMAGAIHKLSGQGNRVWCVDPDRDLIFRDPSAFSSGFLFTDDLAGYDAQNWPVDKLGIIRNFPHEYSDGTVETGYSFIYGIAPRKHRLDVNDGGAEDASRGSDDSWIAIPFTPVKDNVSKIALLLSKVGTITGLGNMKLEIVGEAAGGGPDRDDIRRGFTIKEEILQALGATGVWKEAVFERVAVTPGENLFLIIKKFGDASNNVEIDYETLTGTYYTSSDGSTWSSATGKFSIRTYHTKQVLLRLQDTVARKTVKDREKPIIFRNDIQVEAARESLFQAAAVLAQKRRVYSNVIVSPTTDRIPLAKYCRVQKKTPALDVNANIVSIDINFSAFTQSALGANSISLGLEEIIN